jgi:ferredoxin-NADP reductase
MLTQKYTTKLIEKIQLTRDIYEIRVEKPENFDFISGQFIQFFIPNEEKTITRSYSISSTPSEPYLEFCIKFLEGGLASSYIRSLNVGDTLDFQGPRGLFVQKENNTAISFIATGTGIAPCMSIIRDELQNKKNTSEIRLLFGVRNEDDVFWTEQFKTLKIQYPNFTYDTTLSQAKIDGGWAGLRGRVTEHILRHLISHKFFLCGNAAMVKDIRNILLENGVDVKSIHFEIF